jgi:hypothetical protein
MWTDERVAWTRTWILAVTATVYDIPGLDAVIALQVVELRIIVACRVLFQEVSIIEFRHLEKLIMKGGSGNLEELWVELKVVEVV